MKRIGILPIALVFFTYLLFLGHYQLFDWDEINFAECAREMLVSGDWLHAQINFKPFWEKPPLFFWLQAISMKIFGINEFAARFPNAIFGFFTLWLLFFTANKLRGPQYAFIVVALYTGSILPYIYFKSGIIDPVFNFFAFAAAAVLVLYEYGQTLSMPGRFYIKVEKLAPLIVGVSLGLSTLAKGPVNTGLLLISYIIYRIIYKRSVPVKQIIIAAIFYIFTISLWVVPEILVNGTWFLEKFFLYQLELYTKPVAGHGQPFYYHFIVLLIGCFPMVVFFIRELLDKNLSVASKTIKKFMIVWFWVILLVFSISTTKIIHYSSMTYIPMVFIAAIFIDKKISHANPLRFYSYILYFLDVIIIGTAINLIPILGDNTDIIKEYVKDPLVRVSVNVEVHWESWWSIFGILWIIISLYLLIKFARRDYAIYLLGISILNILILNLIAYLYLPRIAEYTQGPAVEFFKSLKGKDVYVTTYKYKSYAHYFYTDLQPENAPFSESVKDLVEQYKKPVYVSTKVIFTKDFEKEFPQFKKIKQKGAFAFYFYER